MREIVLRAGTNFLPIWSSSNIHTTDVVPYDRNIPVIAIYLFLTPLSHRNYWYETASFDKLFLFSTKFLQVQRNYSFETDLVSKLNRYRFLFLFAVSIETFRTCTKPVSIHISVPVSENLYFEKVCAGLCINRYAFIVDNFLLKSLFPNNAFFL